MFKISKLFIALSLVAAPVVGCTVEEDDGGATGTDTATDTTPTTSTSAGTDTTDTMTTAGTDSGDSMTTAGTDTAGTDSAGTDTAGTDTAGTDTAGTDTGTTELGVCLPECAEAVDCCAAFNLEGDQLAACTDSAGADYPFWACDEGFCDPLGCSADADCEDAMTGDVCTDGICGFSCDADPEDCPGGAAVGWTCPDTLCVFESDPCEADEDCGDFICDTDSGDCIECVGDGDCGESVFGALCDVEIGFCGCAELTDCFRGDTCV